MLNQTSKLFTKKPKTGYAFIYHYWINVDGKDYHYIGSTIDSLKNRAGAHGRNYASERGTSGGRPGFDDFIRDHGFNNFNVEILEEVPVNDRFIKENYYINLYDSVNDGLNKISSSTYNRAATTASYKTNKADTHGELTVIHLPDSNSCIVDTFVYKNYLTKYAFGLDHPGSAGRVSFFDENHVHRTLAGLIAKSLLGPNFDTTKKSVVKFINKDVRDFRLGNLSYKGKSLAEWLKPVELKGAAA
jgi:hypothetical protein